MCVLYEKETLVILNWSMGRRPYTLGIESFFFVVILTLELRNHLMDGKRMKFHW